MSTREFINALSYSRKNSRNQTKIYRILGGHCTNCSLAPLCFGREGKSPRGMRIIRNVHWKIQEITNRREQEEDFRAMLGERQWKMEGLFAKGKNYHGLGRARYRRRHNMQIQAFMIANVQNIKRLIEAFGTIIHILIQLGLRKRKNIFAQTFAEIFETLAGRSPIAA